jgi:hypothetical protein
MPAGDAYSQNGGSGDEIWDLSLTHTDTEVEKDACDETVSDTRRVSDMNRKTTTTLIINTPVKLHHKVESNNQNWYGWLSADPEQEIPANGGYSVDDTDTYYVYEDGHLYSESGESSYTSSASLSRATIEMTFGPESESGDIQVWGKATGSKTGKQRVYTYTYGWSDWEPISETVDQDISPNCEAGPGEASGNENNIYKVSDSGIYLRCVHKWDDTGKDCSSTTREEVTTATLTPHQKKPLKANPGGPYTAERGTPINLDGTGSTGSITEYTWTFAPGTGCPSGLKMDGVQLKGANQKVTFLCPVTATLTVTDGKDTDSASVPVSVTPRSWTTPFATSPDGVDTGPMSHPPWFNNPSGGGYEGGANVCGLCAGTATENSNLHPPAQGGSWETSGGYKLAQVGEPGKPFDGYWYVSDYSVQVNREILVNPYILPLASGGKELPYAMGSFYQHNLDQNYDIAGYLAGVRKHEQDHSDRMKLALQSADPAPDIEKLVSEDRDSVKTSADTKLRDTEKLICQKSSDASQPPMPVTWTGKLLFPTSDTNQWKEGETSVGGYREDAGESCG